MSSWYAIFFRSKEKDPWLAAKDIYQDQVEANVMARVLLENLGNDVEVAVREVQGLPPPDRMAKNGFTKKTVYRIWWRTKVPKRQQWTTFLPVDSGGDSEPWESRDLERARAVARREYATLVGAWGPIAHVVITQNQIVAVANWGF